MIAVPTQMVRRAYHFSVAFTFFPGNGTHIS